MKREKNVRRMQYTLYGMIAVFGGFSVYALLTWGQPKTDEEGNVIEDKFSNLPKVQQYFLRTLDTIKNYNEILREPSRELLLPPPLEHPYVQPPYTLVVEMNGVLLNPEWTYKTGWRFKKRAFIDYFLQQCGPPLFELVIFTEETGFTAFPLIDNMDPNGFVMHRLFRDSTRYEKGVRIKDLNCLNRDLRRVIHVDWNRNACKLNPDNCLILKKWEGDSSDKSLYDLAQFLRTLAIQGVDDVREVVSHYSKFDDPIEAFRDYQRRLQEHEEQKLASAKQPSSLYADNYVPSTFLKDLRKNVNIHYYSLKEIIINSVVITQEICSIVIFIVVFILLNGGNPSTAVFVCVFIAFVTFLLYIALMLQSKHSNVFVELKNVIIFLFGGFTVSPVLKTLTETISADTIYAMVTLMMLIHLIFYDYGAKAAILLNCRHLITLLRC
ncbi:mitochondrial import inner membrane translocase subunit TIM50-like protein, partial [Dinothrombium tinctorium]